MIEAAGITLREVVEAILVLFIMVTYVERTGHEEKKGVIYWSAGAAVGLSIVLAVGLSILGIDPENEVAEGILYLVAAVLIGTLTIWMVRHAGHFKEQIEAKLAQTTSSLALGAVAFTMVFREGAETVIFLQSLLLSGTSPAESFLGGMLGIVLALLFGVVFLWGGTKINLTRFFRVTAGILGVLALQMLANGLHEFFEVQLLPSNETALAIVGVLTRESAGATIVAGLLLVVALTALYDLLQAEAPSTTGLSAAEKRKVQYNFLKEKYAKVGLASMVTVVVVGLLTPTILAADLRVPNPVPVRPTQGKITIPIPENEGLHKYTYKEARFMVVVKAGTVHVAVDRCFICPPKPYGYDEETLYCTNCGAPIAVDAVGTGHSGCVPRPVDYTVEGDSVILSPQKLLAAWGP